MNATGIVNVMNKEPVAMVENTLQIVDNDGSMVHNFPSNTGSADNSGSFPDERPFGTPGVALGFPSFGLLDTSY